MLGELVSGNYFEVLGVQAQHGRMFLPEEGAIPGAKPVVVSGSEFWKARFSSDPEILGRTSRLNGQDLEVIGVAPDNFKGAQLSPLRVPGMANLETPETDKTTT